MAKRSYRQNCALALTADLVGERWSLLLIRDLLVGPKRYRELAQSLRGIGTNLLATRLKELQANGIVEKCERQSGGHVYELTDAGRALEPAILALVRWGLGHATDRREDYWHQDDWDLVALKATFRPDLAADVAMTVNFQGPAMTAWVAVRDATMEAGLGASEDPDLAVAGTVEDLFVKAEQPAALLQAGKPADLRRFMDCFAV